MAFPMMYTRYMVSLSHISFICRYILCLSAYGCLINISGGCEGVILLKHNQDTIEITSACLNINYIASVYVKSSQACEG